MKLLKDNKGQIRIIEAFFASILLLSSLMLIPAVQNSSSNACAALSSAAHDVLVSLDRDGNLAELVESRNWMNLKKAIQSAISPITWFNLTVFNSNMTCINDTPICSGSAISNNIAAVDYICATTNSNYAVYIIRLQLAQVG